MTGEVRTAARELARALRAGEEAGRLRWERGTKALRRFDKDDLLALIGLRTKRRFEGVGPAAIGFAIGAAVGAAVAFLATPRLATREPKAEGRTGWRGRTAATEPARPDGDRPRS